MAAMDTETNPTQAAHGRALAGADTPTSAASIPLNSFVGREGELREVKRLLGGTPLLTLTSPGGVGKTRLALEAARDLQRRES